MLYLYIVIHLFYVYSALLNSTGKIRLKQSLCEITDAARNLSRKTLNKRLKTGGKIGSRKINDDLDGLCCENFELVTAIFIKNDNFILDTENKKYFKVQNQLELENAQFLLHLKDVYVTIKTRLDNIIFHEVFRQFYIKNFIGTFEYKNNILYYVPDKSKDYLFITAVDNKHEIFISKNKDSAITDIEIDFKLKKPSIIKKYKKCIGQEVEMDEFMAKNKEEIFNREYLEYLNTINTVYKSHIEKKDQEILEIKNKSKDLGKKLTEKKEHLQRLSEEKNRKLERIKESMTKLENSQKINHELLNKNKLAVSEERKKVQKVKDEENEKLRRINEDARIKQQREADKIDKLPILIDEARIKYIAVKGEFDIKRAYLKNQLKILNDLIKLIKNDVADDSVKKYKNVLMHWRIAAIVMFILFNLFLFVMYFYYKNRK